MKSFSDFSADTDAERMARKSFEELKDLDEGQLEEKLFSEVAKQKREGSFNYDLLSSSVESIRPFLSNDTYLGLKNLLEKIR